MKVETADKAGNFDTRAWWGALLVVYILTALLFSIIQPLGRAPDEPAHMQYVAFLAEQQRLPIWEAQGGGEAGYEAQHPPLYYLYSAIFYALSSPLAENWRWHVVRWAMILVGCALFAVCRRFFEAAFATERSAFKLTFAATATVMLMPLTLLYTCHVNPDGFTLLLVALGLYLAWLSAQRSANGKTLALLGFVCGLAALTKLSGAPILLIALAAQWQREYSDEAWPLWKRTAVVLAAFLLTCGWWYGRSLILYGTPFVHTEGKLGTGLSMAAQSGFPYTAWFTWRETYLSTWAQRGWFSEGFWTILLYAVIIAATVLAAIGLWKLRRAADAISSDAGLRRALNLSAALMILVFLGHQWAFWTVDVEFNAGGRYMLVAMPAIALLLVTGLAAWPSAWRRVLLIVWLCTLPVMNAVSAWNIDTVLNPRYAPEWQIFQFPPGEEP